MSTTNSIEHCWVLIGEFEVRRRCWRLRRRRLVRGRFATVEADWTWALAREEKHSDVAGFWHTHPRGAGTAPSERDVRTMQAWSRALGKPLVCVVAEGQAMTAYIFPNDQARARRAQLTPTKTRGTFVVQ